MKIGAVGQVGSKASGRLQDASRAQPECDAVPILGRRRRRVTRVPGRDRGGSGSCAGVRTCALPSPTPRRRMRARSRASRPGSCRTGVVAGDRGDRLVVDARRPVRSPASSASAGWAEGRFAGRSVARSRVAWRGSRQRIAAEHASCGDVDHRERETPDLQPSAGQQVAVAWGTRLELLGGSRVPACASSGRRAASTRRDSPGSPARSEKRAPRVSWMASRIHSAQRSATSSSARRRSGPSGTSSAVGFTLELIAAC